MKSNHSIKGIVAAVVLHGALFLCLLTFRTGAIEQASGPVRVVFTEEKQEAPAQEDVQPEEAPVIASETVQSEVVPPPVEQEIEFEEPVVGKAASLDALSDEESGAVEEVEATEKPAAPGDIKGEPEIENVESREVYAAVEVNKGGVSPSKCGNGVLERGEECDDGNHDKYDGCSSMCRIEDEDQTYRELYVEYGTLLRGYISKFTRYPERARMKRLEGVAIVTFEIYRDGKVKNIQLEKSSGFSVLDREAMESVRYPERLPAPQENLLRFGEPVIGRMHFNFTLNGVSFEE